MDSLYWVIPSFETSIVSGMSSGYSLENWKNKATFDPHVFINKCLFHHSTTMLVNRNINKFCQIIQPICILLFQAYYFWFLVKQGLSEVEHIAL